MDHFVRVLVAQDLFNLVGSKASDLLQFRSAIVYQASGKLLALGAETRNQIPPVKCPSNLYYTRREKALFRYDRA